MCVYVCVCVCVHGVLISWCVWLAVSCLQQSESAEVCTSLSPFFLRSCSQHAPCLSVADSCGYVVVVWDVLSLAVARAGCVLDV